PMSALYGSDALGGVVNIITKRPNTVWRSQLQALGNWADDPQHSQDYQLQAATSGALIEDVLALRLSGTKQYQQDVPNRVDARLSDIEGQRREQARAQLDWYASAQQRLSLTLAASNQERWRDTQQG